MNFVVYDPESGSVTQGHGEKWVQKSCVSFEEECSDGIFPLYTLHMISMYLFPGFLWSIFSKV